MQTLNRKIILDLFIFLTLFIYLLDVANEVSLYKVTRMLYVWLVVKVKLFITLLHAEIIAESLF